MADIFFHSQLDSHLSSKHVNISIRAISNAIGECAVQNLLIAHAISGSHTTSALFGHDKCSVWHKFLRSKNIVHHTDVIGSEDASHTKVAEAGVTILKHIYGGKSSENLNHLRYTMYMNMTARSSVKPCPERLPHTENAAMYHIYRVHFQMAEWRSLLSNGLRAEDWGWKLRDRHVVPNPMDIEVAPAKF